MRTVLVGRSWPVGKAGRLYEVELDASFFTLRDVMDLVRMGYSSIDVKGNVVVLRRVEG